LEETQTMTTNREVLRIAAVGDIHCGKNSQGAFQKMTAAVEGMADVLLLVGDLTDYGTEDETRLLVRELSSLRLPVLCVLGNHDFESGQPEIVARILRDAGIIVLDGDTYEFGGVGFAGVKGFAGGFGRRALAPWGEPIIKQFVHEGIEEALKLESAIARLRTPQKVVLLHYAPIHQTIVGEPEEIIPFLGSTRLEEVCDRFRASVVFHGHAHHGTHEGRTKTGIPVFNCALPLLKKTFPDGPPFKVFELALEAAPQEVGAAESS
jgi:Icc-related predicted phosphoesterase